MAKNFLIITEGSVTEPDLLEAILKRYDFNVLKKGKVRLDVKGLGFEFDISELSEDRDNVIIAQGPRNRIHDFLSMIDRQTDDVERMFSNYGQSFAGVFLVYDVDHTLSGELEEMFNKFRDESSGLLLLSSPCIEILSEPERTEPISTNHLKTYKSERNVWAQEEHRKGVKDYIIANFEELVTYYIQKNCLESGSDNVMEHPEFVVRRINALNDRKFVSNDVQPVIYRYFTTTMYVCIAYILGLTKEIENSERVLEFFESRRQMVRI